ncbi:hypothetical protein AN958_02104, partial [Leucoagaricus sp. SymC.cos]
EPTSYNDPFRAIALRAPKPPDSPICCLKPLPPLDPVEDDLLLSFEEWKARQHPTPENVSTPNLSGNGSTREENGIGSGSEQAEVVDATPPPLAVPENQQPHTPAQVQAMPLQISPHFRVPLVDRFNYASLDCSARVHKAHKGAKHPSNILSSKKDRYMLSPCKTKGEMQFVIIELCEDIKIDTVQLANFEFFSGVFKDFTVRVTKTLTTWKDDPEEGWTVAGTYKAKHVRGVQSFHLPPSLRDFYRYLRIDFHSHYGSEYYCPVSLVRVYGLTHLEEWKWELWEVESRTKMETTLKDAQMHRTTETLEHVSNLTDKTVSVDDINQAAGQESTMPSTMASPVNETGDETTPATTVTESPPHSTTTHLSSSPTITQPPEPEISPASSPAPSTSTPATSSPTLFSSALHASTDPPSNATPPAIAPNHNTNTSLMPTSVVVSQGNARGSSSSITVTASPLITTNPYLPVPISGGESIYRMIMNRLIGLERNQTLYEQYMSQQQLTVREALKRLSEDIGRLEGLGKAQRQAHDRIVLEWEKQRKQWQMEHAQLLQRIDYLSDEIIMEKRLGIAQLCLLLAVLVFISLTRGSQGPVIEDRRYWPSTLKSLSGDWRRLRLRESDDLRALRYDGQSSAYSKSAPVKAVALDTADSVSNLSGVTDVMDCKDLMVTRIVSPTTAAARLLSGITLQHHLAIGVDLHQGLEVERRPGRAKVFYFIQTPHILGKGNRVAGVYSPRPMFASIRSNVHISNPRRAPPLQRSYSSHGPTGSIDYVPGQTWTGSGNALKSARKWARTAHLHEVKVKRREDESGSVASETLNGDRSDARSSGAVLLTGGDEGPDDVFSGACPPRKHGSNSENERARLLIMGNDDAGADTDGWESASDVGVDSVEGI